LPQFQTHSTSGLNAGLESRLRAVKTGSSRDSNPAFQHGGPTNQVVKDHSPEGRRLLLRESPKAFDLIFSILRGWL